MKKISLCGKWRMTGNGFDCVGDIPGSVYSFLLSNGKMSDPYYRLNEAEALALMEHDYAFSRTFTYEKSDAPLFLRCEGLDTLAEIEINGKMIAHTKNMHRTYSFDITDAVRNGENEICITFRSPNKYVAEKFKEEPLFSSDDALMGFMHLRKAHCMFGWDWGPRLPDAGIWRDISLVTKDSPEITELRIFQRHENESVFLTTAASASDSSAVVRLSVTAPDGAVVQMENGTETKIEAPLLWWPNGLGEQNLYEVRAELVLNGEICDTATKRVGLRTLRLVRERDSYGESFCHEVNGVRFFAMGADYIPEDNILSRVTRERTDKLIRCCKDSNFNAVRVWGGGYYPDDFFYDSCDEAGLVVFQDMMFACSMVSAAAEAQEEIEAECRDNLSRIRHHACLAVISGNNEVEEAGSLPDTMDELQKETYLRIFEDVIPNIVKEICPEIPYVSSSPSTCGHFIDPQNENYGDSHYWKVWHGGLPFAEYRNHYFRYLSEFGFESFPCEKTMNTVTEPNDRNIFSRVMEMHQRSKGANVKIMEYLGNTFLYPTDFSTLLYASQLLQAEAIRYGVEHLRRNRGRCMGTLYWQLNDIWPSASWASIDYYGRYKALQYVAKRFYSPVLLTCEEVGETTTRPYCIIDPTRADYKTTARFSVTNDTLTKQSGTIFWELRNAASNILKQGTFAVEVSPLSVMHTEELDFQKTDVLHNYLSFSLVTDNGKVSEGTVLFTAPKHFEFENPQLTCSVQDDIITVTAEKYAKYVEIDSPDSDFILSDNYFDINGGETKIVKVLDGTPKTIRLRSVYDIC